MFPTRMVKIVPPCITHVEVEGKQHAGLSPCRMSRNVRCPSCSCTTPSREPVRGFVSLHSHHQSGIVIAHRFDHRPQRYLQNVTESKIVGEGKKLSASTNMTRKERGKMEKRKKLLDFCHWSCNLPNMIPKSAWKILRTV